MIRLVKRCMSKSKLSEHKWDGELASTKFTEFKNTYVNGIKLTPEYIFKNGDIIEVLETPKDPVSIGAWLIFSVTTLTSVSVTTASVVGWLVIGLGVAALAGIGIAIAGTFTKSATAAGASETSYTSNTHPEITGASNEVSNGNIPVIFGKTQQTPSYGQLPYRLVGDGTSTNKYRQYFIAGYKNVVYSDFKLEDTSKNDFSADKLDVIVSNGGSTFIGWENVKSIDVGQKLTYDSSGEVQQSNNWSYNQSTTSTTLKIDFIIEFTNVVIASWGNKTFNLKANVLNGATPIELSQSFTVASGDLTLVSGTTYRYSGTKTFTQDITSLLSTSFYPTAYTRTNSEENTSELDVIYVSEDITTDDFTNSKTFNQAINYYQGTMAEVVQTSPVDTLEIDVITSFAGLYTLSGSARTPRSAKINIQYKEYGASSWKPISDASSIYIRGLDGTKNALSTSSTTVSGAVVTFTSPSDMNAAGESFFRPIGFVVPKGKYVIRVRSADYSDKTIYDVGEPTCAEVQFRMDGNIVNPDILPKVTQISVEATAYAGLSGTLKKFNAIAEAVIPIWNGTDWNTEAKTTNPAAIVRYLLTDNLINPRAISTDLIDNDTLIELYNWGESSGYKASGIIIDEIKSFEVITNILSNCQSAMIPLFNGKHTFVTDNEGKIPVGLFNQHNSYNFKWKPAIERATEALRVSFLDNDDYTTDELTVYYYTRELLEKLGYTESEILALEGTISETPLAGSSDDDYLIIKTEYKYVNDRASVLKIATNAIKTIQEKRNTFEFDVNLEALNMLVMDRILVSNTTNMENKSTELIKDVILSGGNLTGFQLYSEIEIPENAKIVIRSLDYVNEIPVIYTYDVLNKGLSDVVNIAPIVYNGNIKGAGEIQGLQDKWHYDGDLFSLGQDIVYDCVVTDIKYNEDNTATITARDY